jgi:hypothetical protein
MTASQLTFSELQSILVIWCPLFTPIAPEACFSIHTSLIVVVTAAIIRQPVDSKPFPDALIQLPNYKQSLPVPFNLLHGGQISHT